MAGLKKPPAATSSGEKSPLDTGERGHDNWVRWLVFHSGGKYLLSVANDNALLSWDLFQEGRMLKKLDSAHGHFVSCIRWAPAFPVPVKNGAGDGGTPNGSAKKEEAGKVRIRCAIATKGVHLNVRAFIS